MIIFISIMYLDFIEYASMHQFITLMQKSFTQADRVCNLLQTAFFFIILT